MRGQCFIGQDIDADVSAECDVCIVGSGAGGSVLAAKLVESGLKVIMVEEGGYFTRETFSQNEGDAYFNLYQDRGTRASADVAITILQGRSAGGGTTVNWTSCFRTPDRILRHWESRFGVEGLTSETLAPHFAAVEERLGIQTWPLERANANNRILVEGCRALGWEVSPMRRNVRGCADTGSCGMGCPAGAKQSMHRTYLQDALDLGLTLYCDVRADRFLWEGRRVTRLRCSVLERESGRPTGRSLEVKARVFVSSCGAINGPGLLLRSGLSGRGRVGRRTMIHPVVALPAVFEHEVSSFYGAPQSVGSHQFVDRGPDRVGYFMESAPIHPVLGSLAFSQFGRAQGAFMAKLPNTGVVLALGVDGLLPEEEGGRVSLREDGRTRFDYPVGPPLQEMFREAHKAVARLEFAAGAKEVLPLHVDPLVLRSVDDVPLLDTREYGALKHGIFSAHQMGGCAMGVDPEESVVDSTLRYHGLDNLFVVDGSVFPTALGVNPSESIYGLAHWGYPFVAARV